MGRKPVLAPALSGIATSPAVSAKPMSAPSSALQPPAFDISRNFSVSL